MKGQLPPIRDVSAAVERAIPHVRAPLSWRLVTWLTLNLVRLPAAGVVLRSALKRKLAP